MSILNRLPFPNRNSDSGNLYIVFKRFHLIFPVAHLDFQVEARFIHSLSNHAYASHTASRISYHVHALVVYYVVCFFPVLLLRVGSVNIVLWGFVRLRPFVFFMDSFFFLAGFQARWSYPRNHYYLCYASLLALLLCQCYDAYHLLSSLPNCHVKPLTHHVLANRWLAMLPLCSAPLIALLVAGEDWRPFLVGTFIYLLWYHYIILLS